MKGWCDGLDKTKISALLPDVREMPPFERILEALSRDAEIKIKHARAAMSQLSDFLKFEHYLTPSLFRIFYLLQLVLIVLFTISNIFAALATMISSFLLGFIWLVGTLIGAVAAVIAARILTEIIMVLFQNNEHLAAIRARAEGR
jgi:hypothetical protein